MNEITNKEILGCAEPNIIVADITKASTLVKVNGVSKNAGSLILAYKLR
ncbi:hypothetical protein M8332_00340 [Fructilactobacillus ixorae]|uniref:Uncharacterized protein n=1 Tax=Fructilactobacillus ixorae TaxID=1750535 RepID=A0ABY5C3J6_9LACO|nr:hypothetical protein [Fructilactobacillus ixorae]USS93352.1 hypothetical protein M8332_00340 [Fructilactobacillus ixorae]